MSTPKSYVAMARAVLAGRLSEGFPLTTQEELMAALSVLPEEKRHVYRAVSQLKRRGELAVEGKGFRYLPEAAPEPLADRIYRVIRASKGGFTVTQISSIAEINPKRVHNVIMTLAGAGYLKETGKEGKSKVWLATQKCRDTPSPPRLSFGQGAFMQERRAVAKLVEIFMSAADLSGPTTAKNVREQLDILNRRFAEKGSGK